MARRFPRGATASTLDSLPDSSRIKLHTRGRWVGAGYDYATILEESCVEVDIVDVDGDDDLDLAAALYSNIFSPGSRSPVDRISIVENTDSGWREHIQLDDVQKSNNVEFTDLDQDGDPDLVASAIETDPHAAFWLENDGSYPWNSGYIDGGVLYGPWDMAAGDITGDGLPDLVAAGTFSVRYFVNDGFTDGWPQTQLDELNGTTTLDFDIADYDKDADNGILAARNTIQGTPRIGIYRNDGGVFTERVIEEETDFDDAFFDDFNGDGRLDVMAVFKEGAVEGIYVWKQIDF